MSIKRATLFAAATFAELLLAFVSRPLLVVMAIRYAAFALTFRPYRYETVPRIVADRDKGWYLVSASGLFLFYWVLSRYFPSYWANGYVAAGLGVLTIITIMLPVGDLSLAPFPTLLRSHVPVLEGVTVAERRVFMSQMSLRHLLHAGREGAMACVTEGIIGYAEIIGVAMFSLRCIFLAAADKNTVFTHPKGEGSLLDFLYFTVVTVTTIGYGDWSPRAVVAKAVVVGTVLLGIAYVGAILTPAFAIGSNIGSRTASLFRIRRRDVIEDACRFLLALRVWRRSYPEFRPPLSEDVARGEDRGRQARALVLGPQASGDEWRTFLSALSSHQAAANAPSHTDSFRVDGPHWAAYGALFDILQNKEAVPKALAELRAAADHYYYGDMVLAAAAIRILDQREDFSTTYRFRLWWRRERRRNPVSLPMSDLNVWHTALAFRLLVQSPDADAEGVALHDIGLWLYKARVKAGDSFRWSWNTLAASGPSPIDCVDTTSVVYEALAVWSCSHPARLHALASTEEYLAGVESRFDGLLPSLVWRGGAAGPCPIVTARVCSLLPLEAERLSLHWKAIEDAFASASTESPSPWYVSRVVALGVVSSYAPATSLSQSTVRQWAADLSMIAYAKAPAREELAASLIGLLRLRALSRSSRVRHSGTDAIAEIERRLVDACRIRSESHDAFRGVTGPWTRAAALSYFGGGRCYADPLWSAALCAHALMHATTVDTAGAAPASVV